MRSLVSSDKAFWRWRRKEKRRTVESDDWLGTFACYWLLAGHCCFLDASGNFPSKKFTGENGKVLNQSSGSISGFGEERAAQLLGSINLLLANEKGGWLMLGISIRANFP